MGRGLISLTLWLTLLLAVPSIRIWALPRSHSLAVVTGILEEEIDATKQQLELYKRKAELITEALDKVNQRLAYRTEIQRTTDHAVSSGIQHLSTTKHERRKQHRGTAQVFRDWFEPQSTFTLRKGVVETDVVPSRGLAQLISFRPHVSPLGKRQQTPPRRKPASAATGDEVPLQFLLVLDPRSTVMRLFHPTTHELMWQHALNLRSTAGSADDNTIEIADVSFVSERSAHLTILSTSGELTSFKLRLWHSRRVISGDSRRLIPLRDLDEAHLRCVAGQDASVVTDVFQLPWLQKPTSSLTAPPPGRYLHVDIERVFEATLNRSWCYDRGKIAVVAPYHRAFVIASDTSGGHLSIFNGDNGNFMADLHTRSNINRFHNADNDGIVQLQPLQSGRGLIAVSTRNRVFFMDPNVPLLMPVACEAPERHGFTSLTVDPLRPYIVYAGTSTGRVFVYKLHNFRSWRQRADDDEQESRVPAMCTLVDQLIPRRLPLPVHNHERSAIVQTLPGFLVVGVGTRLILYQLPTSETVRPTYLSEQSLLGSAIEEFDDATNPSDTCPCVLEISAAKLQLVHPVSFALLVVVHQVAATSSVNSTGLVQRLEIYESRIPPPGASLDLSWVRIPAMMVCALAAMFWQQKGRRAHSEGGRSGFDEAELVNLLSGRGGRVPA